MTNEYGLFAAISLWFFRIMLWLLLFAAALPFLATGQWWVRIFDFPRLQFGVVTALILFLLIIHASTTNFRAEHLFLGGLLLFLAVWQLGYVAVFTPAWRVEVPAAKTSSECFSLLVANLKVENREHDAVQKMIRDINPDLLLLIEIDDAWHDALQSEADARPHKIDVTAPDGLGLALWSKLELPDEKVEHLVTEKRPSIFAQVKLRDGRNVHFVGVHPTPPGLPDEDADGRRDSRVRDAELVLVAKKIADSDDKAWIVAGDFNDVAWSHTTRLFKRLSGLLDPRVGRKLVNTYHAEYPLFRYPIDHVFVSNGFDIKTIERIRTPGSDHFAILAEICLQAEKGVTPDADKSDSREARELINEGKNDAKQQNLKPQDQ